MDDLRKVMDMSIVSSLNPMMESTGERPFPERPFPINDRKTRLWALSEQFAHLLEQNMSEIISSLVQNGSLSSLLQWFVRQDQAKKKAKWPYAYLPFWTRQLIGEVEETAVTLAVSWNFLHLSAHLFDDIADEGFAMGPQGQLPPGEGVNLATTFLFLAQTALDSLSASTFPLAAAWELRQQLNRMVLQMCVGQHQDLVALPNPDADQALYWQIAAAKSGNFFGWACQAGAWVDGDLEIASAACAQFGYNLGLLLQIMDDWHDLYTPGGGVSDLAHGKRTLPVLYALTVATPAQKQVLQELLSEIPVDAVRETAVRQIIIELGGLQYVLVQAQIHRQRAQTALDIFANNAAKSDLLTLLDLAFPFTDDY